MALLTRSRRDVPTSVIPTGGFPACADLHESKPGAFQRCLAPLRFWFNLTFGDARPAEVRQAAKWSIPVSLERRH